MDEMRRFEQQRMVLEETQKEIERTRAYGRNAIERLHSVFVARRAEEITGSLVWLNLLYEFMIIDGEAWLDAAAIAESLLNLIEDLEATGQGRSIENLLARSTLAFWRLRAGDGAAALEQLDLIESRWRDVVPQDDAHWRRHRAMKAIAETVVALKQDAVTEGHLDTLRQRRRDMQELAPGGQLVRMIDYTLQRAKD
jgi:hypothetical protein